MSHAEIGSWMEQFGAISLAKQAELIFPYYVSPPDYPATALLKHNPPFRFSYGVPVLPGGEDDDLRANIGAELFPGQELWRNFTLYGSQGSDLFASITLVRLLSGPNPGSTHQIEVYDYNTGATYAVSTAGIEVFDARGDGKRPINAETVSFSGCQGRFQICMDSTGIQVCLRGDEIARVPTDAILEVPTFKRSKDRRTAILF